MKEENKIMLPLGIASGVMIVSLAFGPKVGTIGMFIWLIALGWTMKKTIFARYTVGQLAQTNEDLMVDSFKEKRYVESGARLLAIPLMALGGIVIVMNLIIMFFFM